MIAIYVRVSTEEQLKGYSVEGQINDCIEYAGASNILKYIDDGYTGEILNRPNLTKLLTDVENGVIKKVICYDPDRLSRKLLNQLLITEKLEKNNVILQFVQSDYKNDAEGQLYFQVRGAFSEFDKAKIKHNTMTGRYRKAQQGHVVKNSGLFGYDYCQTQKTYVINDQEAKVVQMIFNYFTDPKSLFKGMNGIAKHLTDMGIPTARGGKVWHRQVVRQMLMNQSYTGTYYQNRYDTEGDYVKKQAGEIFEQGRLRPQEEWLETRIPSIISHKQFNYAQVLLKKARRRYAGYSKHVYLLSGIVRCGRCGETMNGRKRKSHGKDFFVYECRKNYAGTKSKGCGRMMSEKKLNKYVWKAVVELLSDSGKMKMHKDILPKKYIHEEIAHLKTQIERSRIGKKRLLTLASIVEDDKFDIKEIKDQLSELQQQEKKLNEKLKDLQQKLTKQSHNNTTKFSLEDAIKYYLETASSTLDINKRQNILRIMLSSVSVIDSRSISIDTF